MVDGEDWLIARVNGVPATWWIDGGSPEIFALARHLEVVESSLRQIGPVVAETIGERLVPNDDVSGEERRQVLAIRRRLHGGRSVEASMLNGAASLARRQGEPDLAAQLERCAELTAEATRMNHELDRDIESERNRLLTIPARIASESLCGFALFGCVELPRECTLNKRSWRRFVRCWDLVGRAAVVSTPRGWFSHIAVLRPRDSSDPPRVGTGAGVCWTESVREVRRMLTHASTVDEFSRLAVGTNPLSWTEEEHRYALVLDQFDEPSCVVLRETEFLSTLLRAATRPVTLTELFARLDITDEAERRSFGEYVGQLLRTGILQGCAPPLRSIRRADMGRKVTPTEDPVTQPKGWVDVYRDGSPGVSKQMVVGLRERTQAALRFLAAVSTPWRDGFRGTADRWTVVDVLKAMLARSVNQQDPATEDDLSPSPPATPQAAELTNFLASQPTNADVINVPSELIGAFAPDTDNGTWPVDCLLRVPDTSVAGHGPVLVEIWPAGTIDSRFADGSRELGGALPGEAAYRDFLRRIEDLTDVQFVEVTVPPLSDAADNAVRRPGYTSAWTGDPAAATYFPSDAAPLEYIPLRDIELLRRPDGYRCCFNGRQLWPCYHATRTFSPPWDNVAHALLMASPLAFPKRFRRPDILLREHWGRNTMPRVVLDGDLVLSPARWDLCGSTFWEPGAPLRERLRALGRTRQHVGLPRWVFVSDPGERTRIGVDLESLSALEQIDALLKHQRSLIVTEMLPAPTELLMGDDTYPSNPVASELVVRFPPDEELGPLAGQIADRLAPWLHTAE
ncbi:lantibiotic dehydratase [Mycobacterium sp. 3519A]|jgi:hypothetical protein|uniref:lantibiotic dehydratase n=1 Tax=Mycobacterium sp. 3519A TaxID=2057184 RepID=UPI001157D0E4|nr:lantibiotic dehydratase [Mycobacterium sp. 3519A]